MSESESAHHEQPIDLATITADDLLLDALGRGDSTDPGDRVAELLAAWRGEIDEDTDLTGAGWVRPAGTARRAPTTRDARRLPLGRGPLRVAAAVVVAGLAVGLVIGTNHAGPTSPLWPLTKIMYPDRAEARAAEYAIEQARAAILAGQFDQARSLLDEAQSHLAQVSDPVVADQLRVALDTVLRDVSPAVPAPPLGTPADGNGHQPKPTSGPQTGVSTPPAPAPTPSAGQTGPPSTSPTLLPLPLPSLPLPSLPHLLPLPTGGLLG